MRLSKEILLERIESKVKRSDDPDVCDEWTASTDSHGYGQIWDGEKLCLASRTVWTLLVGDIPYGMHVLHKCDNTACIKRTHLFLGTHKNNMEDRSLKHREPHNSIKGEAHGMSKLLEVDIQAIKELILLKIPQWKIATFFGVSNTIISQIKTGKRWRHIT